MTSEKVKVLFLCTGNSCRSQMAEGWCKHLKSATIQAFSAGKCKDYWGNFLVMGEGVINFWKLLTPELFYFWI